MARPPADAPLLNTDLILSRTLEQLQEQGVDGLSLRSLAESLGVKPNALYHYFPSREKLVEAAYSRALNELVLPADESGDWRVQLVALAHAFRQWSRRYAPLVPYLLRRKAPLHAEARLVEAVATQLQRAGVPDGELGAVTRQLVAFFAGTFVVEWGSDEQPAREQEAFFLAHAEQYPVIAHAPAARQDSDAMFEVLLRLLLAGIEGLTVRGDDEIK